MRQVAGQAAGSTAGPPNLPQQGGELELDDDELLELMDDEYDTAPAPAQAPMQAGPDTGAAGNALAGYFLLPITGVLSLARNCETCRTFAVLTSWLLMTYHACNVTLKFQKVMHA